VQQQQEEPSPAVVEDNDSSMTDFSFAEGSLGVFWTDYYESEWKREPPETVGVVWYQWYQPVVPVVPLTKVQNRTVWFTVHKSN
jgi:hypothetical protein